MCASTKPMNTMPLAAIRILSVMVVRAAREPFTRVGAEVWVATGVTVPPASPPVGAGECDIRRVRRALATRPGGSADGRGAPSGELLRREQRGVVLGHQLAAR